eukprot:COSAG01_NODE_661_length_14426_cov_32.272632_1_plen_69_part_00
MRGRTRNSPQQQHGISVAAVAAAAAGGGGSGPRSSRRRVVARDGRFVGVGRVRTMFLGSWAFWGITTH